MVNDYISTKFGVHSEGPIRRDGFEIITWVGFEINKIDMCKELTHVLSRYSILIYIYIVVE